MKKVQDIQNRRETTYLCANLGKMTPWIPETYGYPFRSRYLDYLTNV